MTSTMKKIYIAAGVFFAAAQCIAAQNLSTEVVVDRTIAPTLPQASPLPGLQPSLMLHADEAPALRAGEYTIGSDFAPYTNAGKCPLWNGIAAPDNSRGYLMAGYFPTYKLGLAAGYRIVDNKQDRVSAAAGFNGHSWHTVATDGTKGTLSTNAFKIRADWNHNFASGAVFDFGAAYGHDALKSPGAGNEAFKQNINRADFRAAIRRAANLDYHAQVYYNIFSLSNAPVYDPTTLGDAPSESQFGIDGGIGLALGRKSRFSVGAGIDFLRSNTPVIIENTLYGRDPKTEGIITLNPAIDFATSSLDVRIGVKAQLGISTPGSAFHIAPDVSVLWKVSSKAGIYAVFGGGQAFNTLADVYAYSPFATNSIDARPLYTPVDGRAGLRIGSLSGFSADIHAGYAATRNVAMPSYDSRLNGAAMTNADLSGWYAGAALSFSGNGPVEAYVSGRIMASGIDSGFADARDGAKATLDARIKAHPVQKLEVALTYRLRACRYYRQLLADGTWHRVGMGNISSPGINANYTINKQITAFVDFDNLLCRRTYVLPGIASTRLTGLAGVSIKF